MCSGSVGAFWTFDNNQTLARDQINPQIPHICLTSRMHSKVHEKAIVKKFMSWVFWQGDSWNLRVFFLISWSEKIVSQCFGCSVSPHVLRVLKKMRVLAPPFSLSNVSCLFYFILYWGLVNTKQLCDLHDCLSQIILYRFFFCGCLLLCWKSESCPCDLHIFRVLSSCGACGHPSFLPPCLPHVIILGQYGPD